MSLLNKRPADDGPGWTDQVTRLLMAIFVVELVLGGPGFWLISGISIRRTLVALVTGWLLLLCLLGGSRARPGHGLLMACIAAALVVWVLLIPALQGAQPIADAVQEGFPLALLFTGVLAHAYYRDNPAAWLALRRVAGFALASVAAMALVVWLVGTFLVDDALLVAVGLSTYFTLGNDDLALSLYVQTMPDGFFRVMWITSTLFITGLLYSLSAGRRLAAVLFATALFVSYTRALWLSAAAGIAYLLLREALQGRSARVQPGWLLLIAALSMALVTGDIVQNGGESISMRAANRMLTTFSDESANERVDQVDPLIDAWLASPVFGKGMGSAAAVSRSDVAPYLYELTYLALLMKTGFVGLLAAVAMLGSLLTRKMPRRAPVAHVEASILSFLLACASNPYLLNLVGLGLLCFLFIDRDMISRQTAVRRRAHKLVSPGQGRPQI